MRAPSGMAIIITAGLVVGVALMAFILSFSLPTYSSTYASDAEIMEQCIIQAHEAWKAGAVHMGASKRWYDPAGSGTAIAIIAVELYRSQQQ